MPDDGKGEDAKPTEGLAGGPGPTPPGFDDGTPRPAPPRAAGEDATAPPPVPEDEREGGRAPPRADPEEPDPS